MAQLWKYITELNTTNESHEDSDQLIINQGGRSVQIPWSVLKAGIENKISNIDGLLDKAIYVSSDEEEGYVDADVSIDEMKQEIVILNGTIVNLRNALEETTQALTNLTENHNQLEISARELGNEIALIKERLNSLPTITTGTVHPNTILDELNPKENDVYILANPNSVS